MASKAIITSEYFPPISTFWLLQNCNEVLIEIKENYQKKSTRNRSKILAANGVEILSVPLKSGKNNKKPIAEVEISYESQWIANHLQSIQSAYGNSPYYEHYIDGITKILQSQPTYLHELNHELLTFMLASLDIEPNIRYTTEYIKDYPLDTTDIRNLSFNDRVIDGFVLKKYHQVFVDKHPFIKDLSILDLLMCTGPEGIMYLIQK